MNALINFQSHHPKKVNTRLITGVVDRTHHLRNPQFLPAEGKLLMQLGQWKKLVEHKIQFESPLEILREPMNVWTM
ncbi:hypothetical protein M513_04139 [Trichuris suis]|uniref:Uncharacterized protein n=1 Tax=Trichuris suis TaxID=68888 RepID=A0A085MCL1_9BILA|nr:hypothetical protein M513_04139 [Trichuris suis]